MKPAFRFNSSQQTFFSRAFQELPLVALKNQEKIHFCCSGISTSIRARHSYTIKNSRIETTIREF